jgi:hypothetical protein
LDLIRRAVPGKPMLLIVFQHDFIYSKSFCQHLA